MATLPEPGTPGATGARRGDQVLERLKDNPPSVWY